MKERIENKIGMTIEEYFEWFLDLIDSLDGYHAEIKSKLDVLDDEEFNYMKQYYVQNIMNRDAA